MEKTIYLKAKIRNKLGQTHSDERGKGYMRGYATQGKFGDNIRERHQIPRCLESSCEKEKVWEVFG